MDQPPKQIAEYVHALGLSVVQLHGSETAAYRLALSKAIPHDVEIWQTVRINGRVPGHIPAGADRVLFDTFHPTLGGGTGKSFDWRLLEGRASFQDFILAGGLNAFNAALAQETGARILDFNSGLESAPGIKDHSLIEACFYALRHFPAQSEDINHA